MNPYKHKQLYYHIIMRILVLPLSMHHKNEIGLKHILIFLNTKYNIDYKFGTKEEINDYDIIFSPSYPINTETYKNKKFIFGPHFSVFPTEKFLLINNTSNNSVYIQPSTWAAQVWRNMGAEKYMPILRQPFPVDIDKFSPKENGGNKVMVYYKARDPNEMNFLLNFLNFKNITYRIFDYKQRYNEEDYLNYLQQCKYGIVLDAHESQGFAIEEALSCNVPLLVWGAKTMNQEYRSNYGNIPCTTIPYWDETCGEYFYEANELENKYNVFINNLEDYKPREYILNNLSVEKCAEHFLQLCKTEQTN